MAGKPFILEASQLAVLYPEESLRDAQGHLFAILALRKGISLEEAQNIHGQDKLSTTALYLILTDAHVAQEFLQKW